MSPHRRRWERNGDFSQRANPGSASPSSCTPPPPTENVHIRVISPAIWFSACKQPGIKLCNEFLTSVPLLVRAWHPEQHRFFQHQTLLCCFCVSRPTRARDFNIFQPVAFFCWELYTIKFLTYLCMQRLNGARASYCATEQRQWGGISQKRQRNENPGQGNGFP